MGDRTNTILDGGGSGTVLVLSSPRAATEFVLDGLTIQGGEATASNPGGLILETKGGKVIVKNCAVNGGVSRGSSGVFVENMVMRGEYESSGRVRLLLGITLLPILTDFNAKSVFLGLYQDFVLGSSEPRLCIRDVISTLHVPMSHQFNLKNGGFSY